MNGVTGANPEVENVKPTSLKPLSSKRAAWMLGASLTVALAVLAGVACTHHPLGAAQADDSKAPPPGAAPRPVAFIAEVSSAIATLESVTYVGATGCGRTGHPAEGWVASGKLFHSDDPVAAYRAAYAQANVVGKVYCLAGLEQLGARGAAAFAELSRDFASKDRGKVEVMNGCIVSHLDTADAVAYLAARAVP